MTGPPVAIDLYPGTGLRLADARQVAVEAEQAGFGALWTLEAGTEPFLPLALAAEHTSRLRLGTAVAVALVRNPMVVAHLAHELNRYAAGRLTLGLGTQVGAHVAQRFGEPFDRPAGRMREYVAALRAIWACWNDGAELNFRGEFYRHTLMTPAFHPGPSQYGPPRVHLAAVGPLMCRVAAETADGLIAHPLSSPRVLREVLRPRVASPQAAHFEVSGPVMVITGADDESAGAARTAVRRQIAFYASTPAYRDVLGLYGLGDLADRLRIMSRAGQWDEMGELIGDDLLAEFAVEAPPRAVAGEIRRRYAGLLDRALVYQPYPSPPGLWRELGSGPSRAGDPVRLRGQVAPQRRVARQLDRLFGPYWLPGTTCPAGLETKAGSLTTHGRNYTVRQPSAAKLSGPLRPRQRDRDHFCHMSIGQKISRSFVGVRAPTELRNAEKLRNNSGTRESAAECDGSASAFLSAGGSRVA